MEATWIFRQSKLRRKKYVEKDAGFSINEIILKYVEMTLKVIKIWSLAYQRNIHVKLTSVRLGLLIEKEKPPTSAARFLDCVPLNMKSC